MTGYALEALSLTHAYGATPVIRDLTLKVAAGARQAIIGPNGAGKTTLLHLLTGFQRPQAGVLKLLGQDVTALAPEARVKRGLVRSFQINQLFPTLSPRNAVRLALAERDGAGCGLWKPLAGEAPRDAEAEALLTEAGLHTVADRETRHLPYGQQRLLEIALALALRPQVLLLDEPAAGVPRDESAALIDRLLALPPSVTVLLIDHDMDLVFRFAERISVLVAGTILTEGPPAQIAKDARVRAVYLGEETHV
ncbi:ABC transporter ATP-binding protein [Elstera cyanobacteriorum]|uniref:ABC transporter ATP-binding protein n=1 Tax=Elstera cyanobacteriorum TaxID=2022747 RepID=UPI002353EB82|nr:ATP-binding cassette domain-containing protein [Elstera cyanobacteriorum]MCK6442894.1 ATP-binding cassette domain-containing protein [Elstera cyanobacteriorum]